MGIENDVQTEIEMDFGDGVYLFRFNLAEEKQLQIECQATMGAITARIFRGRYVLKDGETFGNPEEGAYDARDLHYIPRLGLTGGGTGLVDGETRKVDRLKANQLCEDHYDRLPASEKWTLCAALMGVCHQGHPSALVKATDPPKKARPAKTTATSTSPAH